jgi:hypothetical protein
MADMPGLTAIRSEKANSGIRIQRRAYEPRYSDDNNATRKNNMKMIILIARACIAATATIALAASAKADDTTEFCKSVGEYSRSVMKNRQADVPMSDMMEVLDRKHDAPEGVKNVARKMIILAYEQPDFSTEENQKEAIAEFGNEAELACYQQAKK